MSKEIAFDSRRQRRGRSHPPMLFELRPIKPTMLIDREPTQKGVDAGGQTVFGTDLAIPIPPIDHRQALTTVHVTNLTSSSLDRFDKSDPVTTQDN